MRDECTLTSQGTGLSSSNYFETSFTLACTMVTRSGVTILLITLFAVSDGKKRNFEETFRKCQENFECVHRSVCENYNRRLAEYKRSNNQEILTELKSLICNKGSRAVCCKKEQQCRSQNSCGRPQKIPESVKIKFQKTVILNIPLDHQWNKNFSWGVSLLWASWLPKECV